MWYVGTRGRTLAACNESAATGNSAFRVTAVLFAAAKAAGVVLCLVCCAAG
jgi:hypothetical protein